MIIMAVKGIIGAGGVVWTPKMDMHGWWEKGEQAVPHFVFHIQTFWRLTYSWKNGILSL